MPVPSHFPGAEPRRGEWGCNGCSAGVACDHACYCGARGKRVQNALGSAVKKMRANHQNAAAMPRTQHVCPKATYAPGRCGSAPAQKQSAHASCSERQLAGGQHFAVKMRHLLRVSGRQNRAGSMTAAAATFALAGKERCPPVHPAPPVTCDTSAWHCGLWRLKPEALAPPRRQRQCRRQRGAAGRSCCHHTYKRCHRAEGTPPGRGAECRCRRAQWRRTCAGGRP